MARARSRIEDHHAEWLSLVETSGPFLTIPTLKRTLPDGLDAAPAALADLRIAYAEWQETPNLQARWIKWVLQELLELRDAVAEATEADPSHRVAEHNVTLRPTFVVRDQSRDATPAVLLVHAVPSGTSLTRPAVGGAWSAGPIDRAVELARASNIPLALVTDGARWTLVWAREGETTGTCTWRANLWLEEQITLRAFTTLLGGHRFFNLPVEEGLAQLLQESASKQQEVADQLGSQVRRAVELLIGTLDREDRDRHGELLQNLEGAEVYRGAVTVMMRLVFLFVAEERRLLPIDDPRYVETLAASTLRAQLQERADRDSEDPLERSTAAWHRVLALFRAVHAGIEHDALRLPAYGGGLFDPDRYPFLEGRAPESLWRASAARPLPVDDRTMLHLLDALQTLEQGGARVLLSYRALDVEQIGHVYEGLLDHTAIRLSDTALALGGKNEPEVALGELDRWTGVGEDGLVERLARETGKSASAVRKALELPLVDEARSRLRAACANDDALLERVAPYHGLLRNDLRGDPLVFLAGALFVTQALDRRASGTYYTPRQLAEEVVQHALDPIAYDPGPAQERDPANWNLKTADALLDLKVADIAMGSGAFLVAACRYLAARLQEAWLAEGMPIEADIANSFAGLRGPLPADPIERDALAHRLVAERCLYGVDKNPMAVEMAKLSLWLITLAKDRPFSFVDHALRTGDSLLGITTVAQLRAAHLVPRWRQGSLNLGFDEIDTAIDRALALRHDLEGFVVRDISDAERKASLLADADLALDDARLLGDLVVGAALTQRDDGDPLATTSVGPNMRVVLDCHANDIDRAAARTELRDLADDWLVERRPAVGAVAEVSWADRDRFHWALEFPEVRAHGGFDAIVGNPPFQGGVEIARAHGVDYERYLKAQAPEAHGFVDIAVYFHRRSVALARAEGGVVLFGPQNLTADVNRRPGPAALVATGRTITWARSRMPWPGSAAVEVCVIGYGRAGWSGTLELNGELVLSISPALESGVDLESAKRVKPWIAYSQGTDLYGASFVQTAEVWREIAGPGSRIDQYLRPYVNAEILCEYAEQRRELYAADFGTADKDELTDVAQAVSFLEARVGAERSRQTRQIHEHRPWLFWDKREKAYAAARALDEVLVCPNLSKFTPVAFVPADRLFSKTVKFFLSNDVSVYGLLQSSVFLSWVAATSPSRGTRIAFSTRSSLDTFTPPSAIRALARVGEQNWAARRSQMRRLDIGLTALLNQLHDPTDLSDDACTLRALQVELDLAVFVAYGWTDHDLGHAFYDTPFGTRFTLAPRLRQAVLTRLLALNHERYSQEVRMGLHGKAKGKAKARAAPAGTMTFDV